MLTVPEAARRARRNPETIRRWIRSGRLASTKIGTQYLVEEDALDALAGDAETTPLPDALQYLPDGRPQPNWERILRESRSAH